MFYFDSTLIETMARERLSRRGQLINLDMHDYRMFASDREVICAVRVRSEMEFSGFLLQLKTELYNAQSAVDEPAELLVHLLAHPEADVTMNNYSALGRTMQELFGDEIRLKVGLASDDSLPNNHKDIMVFVAGN